MEMLYHFHNTVVIFTHNGVHHIFGNYVLILFISIE